MHILSLLEKAPASIADLIVKALANLVPRAEVSKARDTVLIDLTGQHRSDEHERTAVLKDLISRLENVFGVGSIATLEYSDREVVGGFKSLSTVKLAPTKNKLDAWKLVWREDAHSSSAVDDESNKLSGTDNERFLAKMIASAAAKGAISVLFTDPHDGELLVKGVTGAIQLGSENKLVDVELLTETGKVKLSLKKEGFREVRTAVRFIDAPYLELLELEVEPDLLTGVDYAVALDPIDSKKVYFEDGADTMSAVIIGSLKPSSFEIVKDRLTIKVSAILLPGAGLPPYLQPYLRASVAKGGTQRELKIGGVQAKVRVDIVPRFQLKMYRRVHVVTGERHSPKTRIIS